MIEIKLDENKLQAQAFLTAQGVSTNISNDIVMSAKEKGVIIAIGTLSLKNYKVFLDTIVPSKELKDNLGFILGLMKSLLNLADLRGMRTVYGSNPALFDLYKMLRFKKEVTDDGKKIYVLELEGYFTVDSCQHAE
ncbi:MAG: hypothetical protein IJC78_04060 [Clostridia bacterium]|nr:hypothetical protein [Clostridia bacterium]